MRIFHQFRGTRFIPLAAVTLFLLAVPSSSQAQSTNIDYPTAVIANEVKGLIEARDIGDPRLTRHYYLLVGTPGDLIVSVESNNLNGDVDLFTAGSLRPLTKLSIFSGLSTTSTTKSVFLRRRESLILRVEARSANDEPGTYVVRFSGGFEPMAEATPTSENPEPTVADARSGRKKVRRVNSAGALMNEPLPEVSATTEPDASIAPGTVETEKTETAQPAASEPATVKPKLTPPLRVVRRKPPARSTKRKTTTPVKKEETVAKTETATSTTPDATPPAPSTTVPAEPVLNPRLIIETRDGVRVERYMSEVRRVTVERGQLIVVTNTGKVERRPMTSVLRVTIEP